MDICGVGSTANIANRSVGVPSRTEEGSDSDNCWSCSRRFLEDGFKGNDPVSSAGNRSTSMIDGGAFKFLGRLPLVLVEVWMLEELDVAESFAGGEGPGIAWKDILLKKSKTLLVFSNTRDDASLA
jgi:hypothetical protein